MKPLFSLLLIFLLLVGCSDVNKKEQSNLQVSTYVGKVKISKWTNLNKYNVYVSLKLINNTNKILYLSVKDSLPKNLPCRKSYFFGLIGDDTIRFNQYMTRCELLPHDSTHVSLYYNLYSPIVTKDEFLKQVMNMKIKYNFPNSKNGTENNYINNIVVQKTNHSKFVILDDNTDIESAFSFGNIEFE